MKRAGRPSWGAVSLLLILSFVAVALTGGVAELGFRVLLFSRLSWMETLRKAELYADPRSDDYWKLRQIFGMPWKEPRPLHPLLGWVGTFDEQFRHHNAARVGGRRPVLLYGDSFAYYHKPKWFQDYFNQDPAVSKGCYLLNYGVGGYGLDQIELLFKNSVGLYRRPLVVYSFLPDDISRALLSVRIGQKPRFVVADGKLVLSGVPIEAKLKDFYRKNPLRIRSYLLRLLAHGGYLPERVQAWISDRVVLDRQEVRLAQLLLEEAIQVARKAEARILFVIFVEQFAVEHPEGKQEVVERVLREKEAEVVSVAELIRTDMARSGRKLHEYYHSPPDGHPSDLQNRLVFETFRARLMRDCI
jgi:hypothetical protein